MKKITEKEYYSLMQSFSPEMKMAEIEDKWSDCFLWILQHQKVGFTKTAALSLFEDWEMCNWRAMWQEENSEYKGLNRKQLLAKFCGECSYICDRASYDRLFRTHWLFKKAKDMSKRKGC
jgi:hypothetical protein